MTPVCLGSKMDTVVAIGLLQLAPKKITPRVTGALGFTTSLISCYQVFNLPSCINIYLYEWSDLHAFYLFGNLFVCHSTVS